MGKVAKKLLKMLISAFFQHVSHENGAFTRNAIKSVPDVNSEFCFHLQKTNRLYIKVLYKIFPP